MKMSTWNNWLSHMTGLCYFHTVDFGEIWSLDKIYGLSTEGMESCFGAWVNVKSIWYWLHVVSDSCSSQNADSREREGSWERETDTEHSVMKAGNVESWEIMLLFIPSKEASQQFAEGVGEKTDLCGNQLIKMGLCTNPLWETEYTCEWEKAKNGVVAKRIQRLGP